jgi:hypothetical protein
MIELFHLSLYVHKILGDTSLLPGVGGGGVETAVEFLHKARHVYKIA